MAYDVQPSKQHDPGTNAFYVTLQGTEADEIEPLREALAESPEAATAAMTELHATEPATV